MSPGWASSCGTATKIIHSGTGRASSSAGVWLGPCSGHHSYKVCSPALIVQWWYGGNNNFICNVTRGSRSLPQILLIDVPAIIK